MQSTARVMYARTSCIPPEKIRSSSAIPVTHNAATSEPVVVRLQHLRQILSCEHFGLRLTSLSVPEVDLRTQPGWPLT